MKKIWAMLSAIGAIFTFLLSTFLFSLKEEYELIYFNHTPSTMLTVREVNSNDSNIELLRKIENYSKENNINIYRQILNINHLTQYNQDIYTNISDEKLFKETFYIGDEKIDVSKLDNLSMNKFTNSVVSFHPFLESSKEGVEGFYHFQSNSLDEEKLFNFLNSLNMTYEKTKRLDTQGIIEYIETRPSITPLIYSLFFFLVTFVFVSLYEIFNRFKEIAILKMIGNTNKNIIFRLVKEKIILLFIINTFAIFLALIYNVAFKNGARIFEYLIFVLSILIIYFIVAIFVYTTLLVFIKIVNIHTMIKGKKNLRAIKPFHTLSVIIFTVVIIFFVDNLKVEYNKFEDGSKSLASFNKIKGYVSTNINVGNDKQSTYDKINSKLLKMTLDNYEDTVFYITSPFFYNGYDEYIKPIKEELPFIIVNENFVENFLDIGISKEDISKAKNTFTIIAPESFSAQKEKILELGEILELNKTSYENPEKNITKSNYKLLTYKDKDIPIYADSLSKYRFLKYNSSIFLVMTKENIQTFGDMFNNNLFAYYSSGGVLLSEKNGKNITQLLIKEDLDKNIRNTVDIYAKLNKELEEVNNEIIIYTISLLILFTVYYNLIVFSTLSYLEEKKQEIFCKNILGYSFLGTHRDYLASMLLTISVGILLSYIFVGLDVVVTLLVIAISFIFVIASLIVPILVRKGDSNI